MIEQSFCERFRNRGPVYGNVLIISRVCMSSRVDSAATDMKKAGHIPMWCRKVTAAQSSIMNVDRGTAIRLVRRKYLGNDPNISQTAGPVNIWHDMDRAEVSHSHFKGLPLFPGYQDFIFG